MFAESLVHSAGMLFAKPVYGANRIFISHLKVDKTNYTNVNKRRLKPECNEALSNIMVLHA